MTRPVEMLSGGQRQVVALARSATRVSGDRKGVLLLDEPTAALGYEQTRQVQALIRRMAEQGIAIVLVTHNLPLAIDVCRPDRGAQPRPQGRRRAHRPRPTTTSWSAGSPAPARRCSREPSTVCPSARAAPGPRRRRRRGRAGSGRSAGPVLVAARGRDGAARPTGSAPTTGTTPASSASDAQSFVPVPGVDRLPAHDARAGAGHDRPGRERLERPGAAGQRACWPAPTGRPRGWGPDDPDRARRVSRPAYWLRTTFEADDVDAARLHVTSLGLHEVFAQRRARRRRRARARLHAVRPPRASYQSYDVSAAAAPRRQRGRGAARRRLVPRAGRPAARGRPVRHRARPPAPARGVRRRAWTPLVGDGRVLAHVALARAGGRPDRRPARGPSAGRPGAPPAGVRRQRVGRPSSRARSTSPGRAPIAPPVRRVEEIAPRSVTRLRRRRRDRRPRPEHQRLAAARRPRPGGHPARRSATASTSTPPGDLTTTHLDVNLPILPAPLPLGQVDEVTSAGRRGRRLRAAVHHARLPLRPRRGPPRAVGRRRDRGRGALRPAPHGLVRVQRRPAQPAARGGRLVAARQHLRDPDRLPAARAVRLQRRLAGLRADGRLPVRRARLQPVVAARRGARPARGRLRDDGLAVPAGRGLRRPAGSAERVGRLGRRVVSTPVGPLPGVRRRVLLRETLGSATAWVDYAAAKAAAGRHPARAAARPAPAAHEEYLWDTGFHWGEWLEPDAEITDFGAFVGGRQVRGGDGVPAPLRAHRRPDRRGDRRRRPRWSRTTTSSPTVPGAPGRRSSSRPTARCWSRTQASHVRALAFGLVAGRAREPGSPTTWSRSSPRPAATSAPASCRPGCCCRRSPTPVTSRRRTTLLLQDTEPSWLTMLDRGATTVWERWNGVDADGVAHESLNHYSKGAVVSFLHRYVAGLVPTSPGYRTFRVRPTPGGGLTSASLRHDSPFGPIVVDWRLGDVLALDVAGAPRHDGRGVPPRRHRLTRCSRGRTTGSWSAA